MIGWTDAVIDKLKIFYGQTSYIFYKHKKQGIYLGISGIYIIIIIRKIMQIFSLIYFSTKTNKDSWQLVLVINYWYTFCFSIAGSLNAWTF